MVCPNCGFSRTVYRDNLQRGGGFFTRKALGLALRGIGSVGRRVVRKQLGGSFPDPLTLLALSGGQRGAGLGTAVASLAKRVLTSDLARDAASALGAMAMRRVFGEKKQTRRRQRKTGAATLALAPPPRQKRRRRKVPSQQGGILPLAAIPLAALAAKTIGLGALGGAAGFGAQKLLGLSS